jgi:hypothetical protein
MVVLNDLDRFHLVIDLLDWAEQSELTLSIPPGPPPGSTRLPIPPGPKNARSSDAWVGPWAMKAVNTSIELAEPATDECADHHA